MDISMQKIAFWTKLEEVNEAAIAVHIKNSFK